MSHAVEPGSNTHLSERRELADHAAITRMLGRMAHEIVEKNQGARGIALVGIRTGGLVLAERLQRLIRDIEGVEPPLGAVDISLYRDDVFAGLPRPVIGPTELPFELGGVRIVLVDDVLYTGRTVRAALDALMDYGRPRAVELAVLVDRGLRELPIRADYVGMSVATSPDESVKVLLQKADEAAGGAGAGGAGAGGAGAGDAGAGGAGAGGAGAGDAGDRVVVRVRSNQ